MKKVNLYIAEKLKLDKDSELEELNENTEEYKNVKFGFRKKNSLNEFKAFGHVSIEFAYNVIKFIIDTLPRELKDCYLELFYSGNSGFTVFNPEYSSHDEDKYKLGFILFEYPNKVKFKPWYDIYADNKYYHIVDMLTKFIENNQHKFKEIYLQHEKNK